MCTLHLQLTSTRHFLFANFNTLYGFHLPYERLNYGCGSFRKKIGPQVSAFARGMKWVLSVVLVRDAPRSMESKAPIKERSISRPPLPNGSLLLNHDKWLSNKPQTNPTHFDLKCYQVKGATHKAIWGFFPPSRKAFLHQECLIQLQMARMIVEQLTHLWPLHTH